MEPKKHLPSYSRVTKHPSVSLKSAALFLTEKEKRAHDLFWNRHSQAGWQSICSLDSVSVLHLALPLAVSELALPLDFVSDLLWVSRLIHPLKKNGKSFGKREEIKHEDGGLNYEKKRQRDHRS